MYAREVIVSTTSTLEGWEIRSHLGVVSAHVVAGTNVFSDAAADLRNIFGGRSKSYQKQLASIKEEVITQVQQEARKQGANAIVGLHIDHDEISGGGKSMFMVTATGTAVRANQQEGEERADTKAGVLDADELAVRVQRQHLVERLQSGNFTLQEQDFQFLTENRVGEVAGIVLAAVNDSIANRPQQVNYYVDLVKPYLYAIPEEDAQALIYSQLKMRRSTSLLELLFDVLEDRRLLNLSKSIKLLTHEGQNTRKRGLKTLWANGRTFSLEDAEKMEAVIVGLPKYFPERGKHVEKDGMFKSKSVWLCPSGHENPSDADRCFHCGQDTFGFKKEAKGVHETVAMLRRRTEAIRNYYHGE